MEFAHMFGFLLGWSMFVVAFIVVWNLPRMLAFCVGFVDHKLNPPPPPTIDELLADAEKTRRAAVAAHIKRNAAEHVPWEYQWQQFTGRPYGDHSHGRDCDCMAIITARVRGNHR